MNAKIYLDPVGDAPAPPGVDVVATEVEFLRAALTDRPLLIRGAVCSWAETFYEGRGIAVRHLRSPRQVLMDLCPGLSEEDAKALVSVLAGKLGGAATPNLADLVNTLWPEGWWHDPPGSEFAAQWLLWWLEHEPTEAERALLKAFAENRRKVLDSAEGATLEVIDRGSALDLLRRWLGLGKGLSGVGSFPLNLSNQAREALMRELRPLAQERRGGLCKWLQETGGDQKLLPLAAEADAFYLVAHPGELTAERIENLDRFLSVPTRKALRSRLPVSEPRPVPSGGLPLERWFLREYLPFREWDGADPGVVRRVGREFAGVFLKAYSDALVGGPEQEYLSWVRAARLKTPEAATLMIVLDGLSVPDMRHLWEEVKGHDVAGRLALELQGVAFAPLPTITEVAKPALFKGVKPALVAAHPDLGPVCKRKPEVKKTLEALQAGGLAIWSILEPDKAYHYAAEPDDARPDAEGILGNVARKIAEVVLGAPPQLPLRVVVTTDHGRLLGESRRALPVPSGMTSSGRGAVGGTGLTVSLVIAGEIAYLHRAAYGLKEDAAIALNVESFLTQGGQGGTDAYPHGGAFPEEVLIPWWIISRDGSLLPLSVAVSGNAVVGRAGLLRVVIRNPNPVPLDVERLELNVGTQARHELDQRVEGMGERVLELPWGPWPTARQIEASEVALVYRAPDGTLARVPARLELKAEEMYAQDDDPLKEL